MSSVDQFTNYISDWCGEGNVFAVPVNIKPCCLMPEYSSCFICDFVDNIVILFVFFMRSYCFVVLVFFLCALIALLCSFSFYALLLLCCARLLFMRSYCFVVLVCFLCALIALLCSFAY